MRISRLDIAEAYETRQRAIARQAGACRRIVGIKAQGLRQQQRVAHDAQQVPRLRLEQQKVAPVAAVLPGVAVSVRRTGTFGRVPRFGNIIVPINFFADASARRARQGLRHDG